MGKAAAGEEPRGTLLSPRTLTLIVVIVVAIVVIYAFMLTLAEVVVGAAAGAAAGVCILQLLWEEKERKEPVAVVVTAVAGGVAGAAAANLRLMVGAYSLTGSAIVGAIAGAAIVAISKKLLQYVIQKIQWIIKHFKTLEIVSLVGAIAAIALWARNKIKWLGDQIKKAVDKVKNAVQSSKEAAKVKQTQSTKQDAARLPSTGGSGSTAIPGAGLEAGAGAVLAAAGAGLAAVGAGLAAAAAPGSAERQDKDRLASMGRSGSTAIPGAGAGLAAAAPGSAERQDKDRLASMGGSGLTAIPAAGLGLAAAAAAAGLGLAAAAGLGLAAAAASGLGLAVAAPGLADRLGQAADRLASMGGSGLKAIPAAALGLAAAAAGLAAIGTSVSGLFGGLLGLVLVLAVGITIFGLHSKEQSQGQSQATDVGLQVAFFVFLLFVLICFLVSSMGLLRFCCLLLFLSLFLCILLHNRSERN